MLSITREDFCNDFLPSGSGFDCSWEHIKTCLNGTEIFQSYYHNMNDVGYYDGYTKLRLEIPKGAWNSFRLRLSQGKARYMDYSTREYFDTTIYLALEKLSAWNWED